jgi:hypothetical protein
MKSAKLESTESNYVISRVKQAIYKKFSLNIIREPNIKR